MTAQDRDTKAKLIATQTQSWVENMIVKYNICPFARREVERRSIRYAVIEQAKVHLVLEALIKECQHLDANPHIETTLFILPQGFEGFYPYLDLLDIANDLLIEEDYDGIYQLASFHPDYCFEGEAMEDAANYTNRSPYPTLHIIREVSMELALANYADGGGDPQSIPERNIDFARKKGNDFFAQVLAGCMGRGRAS